VDNAFIPNDTGNRDWREYLDWLAAGNIPEPMSPDPAPLTADQRIDNVSSVDPFTRGLVRVIAQRFSLTEAQVVQAIKNEASK
jgi:hypothetical protein